MPGKAAPHAGAGGIRVDSGLSEGMTVTSAYDPMLAKVAAWGPDRDTALRRLDAALAGTAVLGVTTNTAFLRTLLADPDVQAGRLDTTLAERVAAQAPASVGVPDDVLAAGALARLLAREPVRADVDPWDIPDGWRVGGRAWTTFRFAVGAGVDAEVRVRGLASAATVAIGDGDQVPARAEFRGAEPREAAPPDAGEPGPGVAEGAHGVDLFVTYGERTVRFAYAIDGATIWLGRGGRAWALTEEEAAPARGGRAGGADGMVRAPMPGTVLAVNVAVGQQVSAGQAVAVVEAMKMEHTVTAPLAGTVTELTAKAGQQVGMDAPLAVIEPQLNHDGSVGTP